MYIARDKAGVWLAVSLFNIADNATNVGDELLVSSPYARECVTKHEVALLTPVANKRCKLVPERGEHG